MTTERKPHVHAEVIKAWADGVEVQHWSEAREKWVDVFDPFWFPNEKYRVKPARTIEPQPKPDPVTWYLVVYRDDGGNLAYSAGLYTPQQASDRFDCIVKLIPIYTEGEETE
jgi:hypothetical protein